MGTRSAVIVVFVCMVCVHPAGSFADDTISGNYCYTYGDNESLKEAREMAKALAIRNAIESYRAYIEASASVSNHVLTNDIIQMISSGYLKDLTTVEHKEEGRTICDRIRAFGNRDEIETIIRREVSRRRQAIEQVGIDANSCLKVLNSRANGDRVSVTIKALASTKYNPTGPCKAYRAYVFIDFFDGEGNPIGGARNRADNDKTIVEGEMRAVDFVKPAGTKAWRIWLKEKE